MVSKSQLTFSIALSTTTIMIAFFTITSDNAFCYHSDGILRQMTAFFTIIATDFADIIRTVSRGDSLS